MYIATQFSIFMVNKPSVLAQVLGEFARAKINIMAITMMDSVEHGVMRVIFEGVRKDNGGLFQPSRIQHRGKFQSYAQVFSAKFQFFPKIFTPLLVRT